MACEMCHNLKLFLDSLNQTSQNSNQPIGKPNISFRILELYWKTFCLTIFEDSLKLKTHIISSKT